MGCIFSAVVSSPVGQISHTLFMLELLSGIAGYRQQNFAASVLGAVSGDL
jgi:hypothetical protein